MLKYQMLYCRAFARRYAGRPEILAWEYGNEQNCTDECDSPETAWVWLHALAAELRLHDPQTPVASGMHGLVNIASEKHPWGIEDNADAVDLLTTHPYPPFTQGCFHGEPHGPCAPIFTPRLKAVILQISGIAPHSARRQEPSETVPCPNL